MEKFIVNRDDSIYQAWPDLVRTDKDELICIFTECVHHSDRSQSRLALCRSNDRGRTWSERTYLTEAGSNACYYNNARISKLRDGSLVILCDLCKNGDDGHCSTVHLWRGDPDGSVWEGPHPTPAKGIVPDKFLELENGRCIIACHTKSPKTGKLVQNLWYCDNGEWSEKITVADDPRYNLCEASILPCSDGTLVCFMRENSFLGYDCFKAVSHDNGESWEGVYRAPIPGCHRPVSGFLNSGKVLLTYRFLQGGKGWLGSWTQNFFAALMDEKSAKETRREEQSVRILPVDFDRSPVSDLGYSGWAQFDDGEIYIVNYIADDAPNPHIRGYSLRESDFILEVDK